LPDIVLFFVSMYFFLFFFCFFFVFINVVCFYFVSRPSEVVPVKRDSENVPGMLAALEEPESLLWYAVVNFSRGMLENV